MKSADDLVWDFERTGHLTFQSRKNRDAVFKVLKARGLSVRKSSSRNQQLHPEYVADFVGSFETGVGNTDYKTFFGVLYEIRRG